MPAFTVLIIDPPAPPIRCDGPAGDFSPRPGTELAAARDHDATLVVAPDLQALRSLLRRDGLTQAAYDSALLVLSPADDADTEVALLQMGVQGVIGPEAPLERMLRQAIERKRIERAARKAYATDLATGLPHETQLIEHMSQLLALRVREPQPMALLVLRVQGFASAAGRLGPEGANILRRKVAVRLRGGLRASDVVAATGADSFGILLGRMESVGDAERVSAKLVRALQQPFNVAGQGHTVAVTIGMALVPEHGQDAVSLLRRATAQANSSGVGLASSALERRLDSAANDDGG